MENSFGLQKHARAPGGGTLCRHNLDTEATSGLQPVKGVRIRKSRAGCFLSLWLKQQLADHIRSKRVDVAPVYAFSSILAKEGKREEVHR